MTSTDGWRSRRRTGFGRRKRQRRRSAGHLWERLMDQERPVVTESNKDRIRAGVTGHNVRYVLLGGCALVVIAYVIISYVVK